MNGLALCAGVGGLELGIGLALGDGYRTVCYVEREAYAAATLVARMEDAALDNAPVWDDLRTFDGAAWRGCVDIISGGYPCQPFSLAGKRLGERDERHLWPDVCRIVREVQPGLCFFENVPGHLSMGYADVERDLQGLGYRVAAGLYSAAEVGASHKRERLFIMAYSASAGCEKSRQPRERELSAQAGGGIHHRPEQHSGELGNPKHAGFHAAEKPRGDSSRNGSDKAGAQSSSKFARSSGGQLGNTTVGQSDLGRPGSLEGAQGEGGSFDHAADHAGADVADTRQQGQQGRERRRASGGGDGQEAPGSTAEFCGALLADSEHGRRKAGQARAGRQEGFDAGDGGEGLECFPPGPRDYRAWAAILADYPALAPAVAAKEAQPAVCGVADGLAYRVDRLRACGNGVVPLVAAKAFLCLAAKLGIGAGAEA